MKEKKVSKRARAVSTSNSYQLIDSGDGRKLESFGPVTLSRPAASAYWNPQKKGAWKGADATFSREEGLQWEGRQSLPAAWDVELSGIRMHLKATDFGHLGVFPEQQTQWRWIRDTVAAAVDSGREVSVLNLFAYSGGSTLAAAQGGAKACHLDAAKGMVDWARENAELNDLGKAPIRWIVDDAMKFLQREERRGRRYDGIILDPPSFGRGSRGEIFKIEEEILPLLSACRAVLSDDPLFLLFSCHTPGFTPVVMQQLLRQVLAKQGGSVEGGEMLLGDAGDTFQVPSGTFARWTSD